MALAAARDPKRSPRAAMQLADLARKEDVPRIVPSVLSLIKGGGHTMPPTGIRVLKLLHAIDPDTVERVQKDLWDEKSRRLQEAAYRLLRRGVGRSDLAWHLGRARDLLATSDAGQRYVLKGSPFLAEWPDPTQEEILLWLRFFDSLTDTRTFGPLAFEFATDSAHDAAWTFYRGGASWEMLAPLARRFAYPTLSDIPQWRMEGPQPWIRFLKQVAPPEDALAALRSWVDAAIAHVGKDAQDGARLAHLVDAYIETSTFLAGSNHAEAVRLADEALLTAQILLDGKADHRFSAEGRQNVLERATRHRALLEASGAGAG